MSLARQIQKEREMKKSEKDRLATRVVDLWCSFQLALTESKRKYPVQQFFSFASAVRQYTELTRRDRLVRRDVAMVMNGLRQSLELERKRVPGEILYEAGPPKPCAGECGKEECMPKIHKVNAAVVLLLAGLFYWLFMFTKHDGSRR